MRLELGVGVNPTLGPPDVILHDRRRHSPHVTVAHDLDVLPWPWADGRFELVRAWDVMEHLRLDIAEWLEECWRIVAVGGQLDLRVPAWDNPVSYRDPTHRRVFHEETLCYWDPSHPLWRFFGRIYFPGAGQWTVDLVRRESPDPRYGIGDLRMVLTKLASRNPAAPD